MSLFSEPTVANNNKIILKLFSFLPLHKTLNIVRHSKKFQKIVNFSYEVYQLFDFIKGLIPDIKKKLHNKILC